MLSCWTILFELAHCYTQIICYVEKLYTRFKASASFYYIVKILLVHISLTANFDYNGVSGSLDWKCS